MKIGDQHRKIILGSGVAVGTLVFLAIIVAVQYILLQHPKRWDLTQSGKYTLSSQSKKILENFHSKGMPIELTAFYEMKDQSARDQAKDLLDQYRDVYPGFVYSFVDPDKDRSVALQNKIDSYPTLVLKAGDRSERISTADEENVTNALVKLLKHETKKVYLLKGHGELTPGESGPDGFSIAKEQMEKQNYSVSELVLMEAPSVPADCAVLLVAGPKSDPMESEFDSIKSYLQGGGSMLVMLNPFKTPKLCEFLKNYGFETADDIVVDTMSRVLGGDYLMPVITTYIKFPITKNFTLASFFPESRSIRSVERPSPELDVHELAKTSQVSWTINQQQLDSGTADFDPNTGIKGPISVMAVAT
jgi:ABC-type uncharacterized transport system involved in gliding motility auxiliary subunit